MSELPEEPYFEDEPSEEWVRGFIAGKETARAEVLAEVEGLRIVEYVASPSATAYSDGLDRAAVLALLSQPVASEETP